jgi:tRNA pseudouridine55 synthase
MGLKMQKQLLLTELKEGILLVDKPQGKTSFSLVSATRRLTGIKKIGHAGTLDPFATGVMVLLVGRQYTKLSDSLLGQNKRYQAQLHLGVSTDTYDCEGTVVAQSKKKPTLTQIQEVLAHFEGNILQVPPMFSAKKVKGERLYSLARKGIMIERQACPVEVHIEIIQFAYPYLTLDIRCSKGTYIRSLGHDIGEKLGCGAHLSTLRRIESGSFHIDECLDGNHLYEKEFDVTPYLITTSDVAL